MKRTSKPAITVLTLLVGVGTFACSNPQTSTKPLSNHELLDQCTTDMATTFHIHSHLTIEINQEIIEIPAEIGITEDCMSSLHTHNTSGIIHIEAPVQKDFTLGDFFYNWKKAFSKEEILGYKTDFSHTLKVYVDGVESTDFENLILKDDQNIFIDYFSANDGPDPMPAPYDFQSEDL